eukprot:scaffold1167_cov418-Prasinococcus_capsulatus_cf.AAC.12
MTLPGQPTWKRSSTSQTLHGCVHSMQGRAGVRRLGAAAPDLCHVALGIVDAYWEYNLKPWDVAAGVLMVEVWHIHRLNNPEDAHLV